MAYRDSPSRGETSSGTAFRPTKSNIFAAVKAIFHPSTNPGVEADDANELLNVPAPQGGAQRAVVSSADVNGVASTRADLSTSLTGSKASVDNTKAVTLWSFLSLLQRILKKATTTTRGVVLLARHPDVDATETDTTRVPDVAAAKRLAIRIADSRIAESRPLSRQLPAPPDDTSLLVYDVDNGDPEWKDKLPPELLDGGPSLMQERFDGSTDGTAAEQRLGRFLVPDSNNVLLLIEAGAVHAFVAGDDLVASREGDGTTVGGVTFYSNAARHLLAKPAVANAVSVRVWEIEDVQAFATIAQRFLPTVSETEAKTASGAVTRLRRIFTVERVREATEDSLTGLSLANNSVLTAARRSGQNPIEVNLGALAVEGGDANPDVTVLATRLPACGPQRTTERAPSTRRLGCSRRGRCWRTMPPTCPRRRTP